MIGTEFLRELIESVILTGRIKGGDPVSLLLIAAPESGKTSVVLQRPCKVVEAYADVTGKGIHKIIQAQPELTHIVINDLVATLSHKQSVNRYTISQLNAMTEEGITAIASPSGVEKFSAGKRGVIASLTLELATDARHWWNKVGFTSRMLPFCYAYPADLIVEIKESIDHTAANPRNGSRKPKAKKAFAVPDKHIPVEYPEDMVKDIRQIADVRSMMMKEQGMRRLKQYHNITMGHALLRARTTHTNAVVNQDDVKFMKRMDRYVSYDTPQQL